MGETNKKAFSASETENQQAAQGFRRSHEADCQAAQGLGRREMGGNEKARAPLTRDSRHEVNCLILK